MELTNEQKQTAALEKVYKNLKKVFNDTLLILKTIDGIEQRAILMHSFVCSDYLSMFTKEKLQDSIELEAAIEQNEGVIH